MNLEGKQKMAGYLLDEIGLIKDEFITEASLFRPQRKSGKVLLRVMLVAATLSLVMAIGVGSILAMLLRNDNKLPEASAPTKEETVDLSLDGLLAQATTSASFSPCVEEELNYFDGTVRLTVQNRETGELFVSRPLSNAESNRLAWELRSDGVRVDAEEAPAQYRVWILMGDGTVCSPCLAPSEGNLGVASLFDYEAERVPTQYFTDILTSLG